MKGARLTLGDIAAIDAWSDHEADRIVTTLRWPEGVVCARCASSGRPGTNIGSAGLRPTGQIFICRDCGHQFTNRAGTIFAHANSGWLRLIAMARAFVHAPSADEAHNGRRIHEAGGFAHGGKARQVARRWASLFEYAHRRNTIHISTEWLAKAGLVDAVDPDEDVEPPPRQPTAESEAAAIVRASKSLISATGSTYRFGSSPGLSDDDRAAIAKFLAQREVTVVKPHIPTRVKKRQRAAIARPEKARVNAPYKANVREHAETVANEAADWCVQTGMSIKEAVTKTGASLHITRRIMRERREAGANMQIYDDAMAQMRAKAGESRRYKNQLKQLEQALGQTEGNEDGDD